LRCDRHFGLLYWHQVQVDFGSTVVNRFLDRIVINTSLPLMVTAAQQNTGIRLHVRRVIRQHEAKRRLLAFSTDGTLGHDFRRRVGQEASDSVTVNTASGGNATFCLIQMVPETLGC
jgi:hypothetical protein